MRSTLFNARLYGIIDLGYVEPDHLVAMTEKVILGGIDIIQLRAKNCDPKDIETWATQLLPICQQAKVPFIVNDFPDIAARVGADGIHVGQDDLSMDEVRAIVGDQMLVGRSTHSVEQAAKAAADPRTDCIGFGPLFATPTKPDYQPIGVKEIQQVHQAHPDLPIFCIGGIKQDNLSEVVAAGAKRAVIVSGILKAQDVPDYVAKSKAILPEII